MALTNLSQVTSSGIHTLSNYTTHNINSTGIITATEFSGNLSNSSGISTFAEIRVTGNLTVEGTTTTLDSNLTEVDRIEVGANSTNPGIAVTQSGTGHVATFEGGNFGIGTDNPLNTLHVKGPTGGVSARFTDAVNATVFVSHPSSGKSKIADAGGNYGFEFDTASVNVLSGGSEKLRITSGGAVNIGDVWADDSDPMAYITKNADVGSIVLKGNGTGTNNAFAIYGGGWSGSTDNKFAIRADGSVWGGQTSLRFGTGSTYTERLRITSTGQVNINASSESLGGKVIIKNNVDYTTTDFDDDPTLYLLNDDRTTGVSEAAIVLAGRNSAGSTFRAAISGNGSTGLKFYTTNNTESDDTPAMLINGSGNVGIGTNNPGALLQVYKDSAGNLPLIQTTSNVAHAGSFTNNYSVEFRHATSTVTHGMLVVNNETNNARRTLDIADGNGVFASFTNGKVGIGTDNPARKLHINSGTTDTAMLIESTDDDVQINLKDANSSDGVSIGARGDDFYVRTGLTTERLRITSGGKVGIPAAAESSALLGIRGSSTSELTDSSGLYNQGNPCYLQIKNSTDSISDPECGIILQPRNSANGSVAIYAKRTGSYTSDLVYRVRTGASTSAERLRIKNDGNVAIGIANPASKVHIRSTRSYGKDTYASAATGGSQAEPPGTFRWDNSTPVASNGRGYRAWVQSGDAYPNASNYIDVLIRNAGFYRITLKRSHSSADAAVCQMIIYGLANSTNSNYPVVHMTGANGSGTATAAVSSGHGRGSSNAVATFYWEIHSYNVNTHDTIIRIRTTGSYNQGIVALIERI